MIYSNLLLTLKDERRVEYFLMFLTVDGKGKDLHINPAIVNGDSCENRTNRKNNPSEFECLAFRTSLGFCFGHYPFVSAATLLNYDSSTCLICSTAQTKSDFSTVSGGAKRMTFSCVSLQSNPFAFSCSQ
ncbi:hypothetical protein SAMN05216244_1464 [Sediminibacillus halophilus]|uniref:Uncharacterized protein n=1 Tax=Sediminibacillus halophilus TaxID=482461 RepID=A0A1G9PK23_9BACI|nr:hypothetical protein SAMN05216244_1464 [Sediminibacillus halophilus]